MSFEVRQTLEFKAWLADLLDERAQAKIAQWIVRIEAGLFGDAKSVGDGVSELRIDYGPGYRVYFARRGRTVIMLLCGGDKDSQTRDIKVARALAAGLED